MIQRSMSNAVGARVTINTSLPNSERGLSLVELMVSIVVGLILIAAVFNMYTGSVRSARYTEGFQAIQENGRYGVIALRNGLHLAGYSPVGGVSREIDAFDMDNSSTTQLVVQTRQPFDCNGLSTDATDGLAVNTYQLNTDTNELTCTGNQAGSAAMTVVEGVEAFRVLYGVDQDGDDDTCEPQRYIPYKSTIDSADVVALRFAMLVNSGKPIRTKSVSQDVVVLDAALTTPNDRFVRGVFSGTVLLRNNISCQNI